MSTNDDDLRAIQDAWDTVRVLQNRIISNNISAFLSTMPMVGFGVVPESLLLLFAVSTLEDALRHLEATGRFRLPAKKRQLGDLMHAAKGALAWPDFDGMIRIKERRNQVAHDRVFLDQGECGPYLDKIEEHLIAWCVLAGPSRVRPSAFRSRQRKKR